ncbi:hypothetical protein SAMN05216404_101253 [Nitrosospira multiformis]|uniref:Uncharacterized protein n=1 Tax=Nitrosospira multiformis TaxID=1231 RepID=A0A1H8BKH1_9PROT|nr:hypothetical protein SAMN05216404_101253 [Nitrosospira multiformis]
MFGGAALQVLIVAEALLAGFGGGWTVHSRKSGTKMVELESRDVVVSAANEKCAKDVESALCR